MKKNYISITILSLLVSALTGGCSIQNTTATAVTVTNTPVPRITAVAAPVSANSGETTTDSYSASAGEKTPSVTTAPAVTTDDTFVTTVPLSTDNCDFTVSGEAETPSNNAFSLARRLLSENPERFTTTATPVVTAPPVTTPAQTAPPVTTAPPVVTTAPPVTAPPVVTEQPIAAGITSRMTAAEQEFANEIFRLVNDVRAQNGLSTFTNDQSLQYIADVRAVEIDSLFSHTRPNGTSCFSCFEGIAYAAIGENIAYGRVSAQTIFDGWMNSEGHRANILSPNFKMMAVCVYDSGTSRLWTQEFLTYM